MMNILKVKTSRWMILTVLLAILQVGQAQNEKTSADMGADLMSRYIWRGLNLSTSPSLQPYIEVYKSNWTLGAWGSYSFSEFPYQEVDLYISYTYKVLTLSVYDYFIAADSVMAAGNYFDYKSVDSPHAIEAILTLSDIPHLPLSVTAGVFLYGNDYNASSKRAYSTYVELGYDFNIGEQDMHSFVGFTTHEGLYSDGFNCTNLGISTSKEIPMTDKFTLPLSASLILNPDTENLFLVVGLSF